MPLAEDHDMIQTFAPERPDQAITTPMQAGRGEADPIPRPAPPSSK